MPAAFYRHFESMEALGLVLIDESFRTLRDMLRGARAASWTPTGSSSPRWRSWSPASPTDGSTGVSSGASAPAE
ncbi:transcriptional regulatory protein [Mycobacterium xenopi 4042]|uniref:Transcriptional regulatory protein n=1 Tax=Mycobacterium xenopi 4042 TaxID=1299334 RepID=X8EYR4_MYCXE|nr:transcriptional regulatory protein [Mycobacterium xenopi 4042]